MLILGMSSIIATKVLAYNKNITVKFVMGGCDDASNHYKSLWYYYKLTDSVSYIPLTCDARPNTDILKPICFR